jgi:carbohydrate-binding DOMON domain-containing protein
MRVRITSARTAGRPRLAALSCATLMVLVGIALSACTGAPSSSVPAIFSPSGSASGGSTADGSASHSGTETATSTSTKTETATATATTPTPTATTVSPSPVPSTSYYYPTGAPETGGGGTAGLQDGVVFVLGGAAIAAGLGSLAYRRRVTRRR